LIEELGKAMPGDEVKVFNYDFYEVGNTVDHIEVDDERGEVVIY